MTATRIGAFSVVALPLVLSLVLTACDRSDPPSKQLERAAEDAIGEVQGEDLPQIAEGPYAPRNECLDEPGAAAFLLELRNAVSVRDADALLSLSADDIFLDFGGGTGADLLRERLAAEDGYLWDALDDIMELGCASDGARMTMPWYFTQDIPVDPYMGAVVMGEDVPLHSAPNAESEEVGRISWGAVEALENVSDDGAYVAVRWEGGEDGEPVEGYIEAAKLRSIIDYRLITTRRNDRWRITNLVAGD